MSWAPGSLAPRPGAAPLRRMLAAQTAAELKLVLRNGEQVLLSLVIPLALVVLLVTVPVIAADITASARMPGRRKSTGSSVPVSTRSTVEKNSSRPTGMTRVSSRLSPRRRVSRSSIAVCASSIRVVGAAPGDGTNVSAGADVMSAGPVR